MNSPIKLPPLPDLPEPDLVGVSHSPDGDEAPIFEWDEEKLKAWATAYAEQAVRDALAALKIDERAAFEDWIRRRHLDSPSMRWREEDGYVYVNEEWNAWKARASLIPENNHAEGADQ